MKHCQQALPSFVTGQLLGLDIGVDGMKTGYTEASGYAIVSSIQRDGRRLFLAMSGLESQNARREEARKILEWGIRAFERKPLFKDGEVVDRMTGAMPKPGMDSWLNRHMS